MQISSSAALLLAQVAEWGRMVPVCDLLPVRKGDVRDRKDDVMQCTFLL